MNYIYEAEGKNKAEAEKIALEILELDADDVTFSTVTAGSKGLLGLVSRKPTIVRVHAKEQLPLPSLIRAVTLSLIHKMGLDATIASIGERDGNMLVDIESEDSGIIIGKQGRTLDALQFIVNLLIDSRTRKGKRVMLDVAGYRERRQKRLNRLAKSVADRVHKTGQSVLLEYMNPYERRIVHLTLEEDERVTTRSDGTGVYKRVRIFPQGGNRKGANRSRDIVEEMPEEYE